MNALTANTLVCVVLAAFQKTPAVQVCFHGYSFVNNLRTIVIYQNKHQTGHGSVRLHLICKLNVFGGLGLKKVQQLFVIVKPPIILQAA